MMKEGILKSMKQYADEWMKESATYQARKDTLEEWLTELRESLRQGNTVDNDTLANEINELLNWEL